MKLTHHSHQSGFTLAEILTAMAIAVVIFAAIITASLAMQKSFNAVDHYFATLSRFALSIISTVM